jgi:peroxiredoxin
MGFAVEDILLLARLLLSAVFLVASLNKLKDRDGFRQTLTEFGIPQFLISPASRLLPLAELIVGVALIPSPTAWWGAVGAFSLLAVFTIGIGVNLALGKKPDCNCFGQLHSAPIGTSTLVRNGLVAGLAGFVVVTGWNDPGASVLNLLADVTGFQVLSLSLGAGVLGLLGGCVWLLLNLLRQQGRLLLRVEALEAKLGGNGVVPAQPARAPPEGLRVGTRAPAFSLTDVEGKTHTLDRFLAAGKPLVLIFSDPACGPCTALMPDIAHWQKEYANSLTVVPISRGDRKANREKTKEFGVQTMLLQKDREVAQAYQCAGTPGAVVIRPESTIGSPIAPGAEAIKAQVARLTGGPTLVLPTAKVGKPAPSIKLPELGGKTITLADFKKTATVLLFWNPNCGFCQQMLDDLKAWDRDRPKAAPKLLVVSTGTVAQNRAMNLRSPVVLDQSFATGRAYGAGGTPSAVLIDKQGKVAFQVAAGALAVLALLSAESQTAQPISQEQAEGV